MFKQYLLDPLKRLYVISNVSEAFFDQKHDSVCQDTYNSPTDASIKCNHVENQKLDMFSSNISCVTHLAMTKSVAESFRFAGIFLIHERQQKK
jgi:hypothetical protein